MASAEAHVTVDVKPYVDSVALQREITQAFAPLRAHIVQVAKAAAILADGMAKIAAELPTACSRDTDGDGNCGRKWCPECGDPRDLAGLR